MSADRTLTISDGVLWLAPAGTPVPGMELAARRARVAQQVREARFRALFRAPGRG